MSLILLALLQDMSWVEKRVEEWQPKASERKMDRIAWAADVRDGLALAKKHHRPLFLFTLDGRMERARSGAGGYTLRWTTLSSDAVIDFLNAHFVSVYVCNEDYWGSKNGAVPPEDQAALNKIYHAAADKNLNIGSVRVYLCGPDGDPLAIGGACEPAKDLAALEAIVKKLGTPKGKPVVAPKPQNPAPKADVDALVLHLTARPVAESNGTGFYHELPGEDWIVYPRKEWTKFLPPTGATRWEVDRDVAIRLLSRFYPTYDECLMHEHGGKREVKYETASIRATLVAEDRVRLDVDLRMKECFPDGAFGYQVAATATGVVEFDPAKKTIKRFVMATQKATCGGGVFGVAVRSVIR